MKVKTKKDFFQVLRKSRLLSPEERVDARAASQGISEPETIARQLVESGRLTRWQAGQILAGKTKFFLGKYKLLKVCGRGGMGVVFKAEQPEVRTVAIKVLHRSLLSKPRAVSRFMREMRLAAVLNHPNLVVAYDADQIRETRYLVMEYVAGKSLKYYSQKQGRLPISWSCECIRQAALGLAHVHERGLVHRDVKPSNLLVISDSLSKRPRIKILDVGLSRFVSEADEDDGLTKAGQILGTMDYMAPEQIKDARTADIRADIYSLGATLFQLLTGSPPLVGKSLMQTYMARMTQAAPLVSGFRPGISAQLDAVVARMLEREPDGRYHTPAEVAADLADVLSSGTSEADARSGRGSSGDSTLRGFRYESSADDDSSQLDGFQASNTDASFLAFLDQLSSQDELSRDEAVEPPPVLVAETPAPNGALNIRRSHWEDFVSSARRWLRSFFPLRLRSRGVTLPAESDRTRKAAPAEDDRQQRRSGRRRRGDALSKTDR